MRSYRIPNSQIAYEMLGSEVIIIDFTTGNYYALIHVAKQVWRLVEQNGSVEQIAAILSERYGREPASVLADLERFFRDLAENGLLEPSDERAENLLLEPSEGWEYDAPQLQKYTDVQSLLLLDPIHEVSEVGWPAKQD